MFMKRYVGKKVKIKIMNPVYFTAEVTSVSGSHIDFIDKYGYLYSFLISEVSEISDKVKE